MTIRRYHALSTEPADWDRLLKHFRDRTVFHTLAWLRSLEQAHRVRMVLTRVESDQGCVALWPCLEQRKGPLRILGSPLPGWSTVYMGPLFAPEADVPSVMRAFLSSPPLDEAVYMYCKVLDGDRNIDLSEFGFIRRSRYETYLLQLTQTEEELWNNVESRCRNTIRKGRKAGLQIRKEDGPEFLSDFWKMSLQVFSRSNMRPTYSPQLLEHTWKNLGCDGNLLVMSAFKDGHRVATLMLPHDDQTIYYWNGVSSAEYRRLAPNNVLMWEAIIEARRMGLRQFDFVSVYGGPGKYKQSFGPDARVVATHWERSRSTSIQLLKQMYEKWLRYRMRTLSRRRSNFRIPWLAKRDR